MKGPVSGKEILVEGKRSLMGPYTYYFDRKDMEKDMGVPGHMKRHIGRK